MTPLREFFDLAARQACERFNALGKIDTTYFVETKAERRFDVFPQALGMPTQERMRRLFADLHVTRYAVMSEGFMVLLNTDHPDYARAKELRAFDHPDRSEVVHITAEDGKGVVAGYCFIQRPEHGPAVLSTIKVLVEEEIANTEGRMVGLL